MKLSIDIQDCRITSAREGENHDLKNHITTSGEDTEFSYGGWEIKIHVDTKVAEGGILVRRLPSESSLKKIQKRYRLVDGNITIDESARYPIYFSRAPISIVLAERFGITGLVKKNIEDIEMSAAWDPCGHSGTIELAYMLSDGKCSYSCEASGDHDVALDQMSEGMILQRGEIRLKAAGATWVVFCKYSKSEYNGSFARECVLYTMRSNIFLLMRELEAFLGHSPYARFEDCFEEFLLE